MGTRRARGVGETPPAILICVRDSLFATHRGLRDFCEEFKNQVVVYQLDGWKKPSKIEFARRALGSRPMVADFAAQLDQSPALDELASTPYYCELLTDEFGSDGLGSEVSEMAILERGFERIVARERCKDLLDKISDQDVRAFVVDCAAVSLFEGGVPTDLIRELAELVIPSVATEDEFNRLVTQMGQFAVFAHGYDGRLRFAQEPLEHYLVASYLAQRLASQPDVLGRSELPDNVIRLMCEIIVATDAVEQASGPLSAKLREDSIAGRNALRIAVQLFVGTNRLASAGLTGLDLSGVRFRGHMLRGVPFDGSDLTNADFRDTDLTGASFDTCLIKRTRLDSNAVMLGSIRFGEVQRFYSAHVGDRVFDDYAQLRDFIKPGDSDRDSNQPACDAARQLRHLFGKFVEETGRGRRKDLAERALHSGAQIVPNRDEILSETIRAGYLIEVPNRSRISRAQDDSYREIVRFRTELKMSPGIRAILDETCEEADCPHVR